MYVHVQSCIHNNAVSHAIIHHVSSASQACPGGLTVGQIVQTSGGGIRACKKIYHLSLRHWDDQTGTKASLNAKHFDQARYHNLSCLFLGSGVVRVAMLGDRSQSRNDVTVAACDGHWWIGLSARQNCCRHVRRSEEVFAKQSEDFVEGHSFLGVRPTHGSGTELCFMRVRVHVHVICTGMHVAQIYLF